MLCKNKVQRDLTVQYVRQILPDVSVGFEPLGELRIDDVQLAYRSDGRGGMFWRVEQLHADKRTYDVLEHFEDLTDAFLALLHIKISRKLRSAYGFIKLLDQLKDADQGA